MPGTAAAGTLGLLAGYLLKTTLVLTLALVAAAATRRRPAALRHFILSSALIGLLLLPVLELAPVGWRSPLVPAWMSTSAFRAGAWPERTDLRPSLPGSGGLATAAVEAGTGAAPTAHGRPLDLGIPSPILRGTTTLRPASRPDGSSDVGSSSPTPPGPIETRPASGSAAVDLFITIFWIAGLGALFLRLMVGLAGAVRLTSEGTTLDDAAWRVLLERFVSLVTLRRRVRLKSHPEVLTPLTWGWRRPVVLLPDGAQAWTEDERSSALYHELSHIKRADFAVMLLVRTSLALFWWNPLCWIVYRELLKEQEIACDELVLRAGIRPSTYAATLLAFRRSAGFRWNPSAALLGMLGRSSFKERLAAILKQKLTFMEVKMKTKIMLALALVLAVALIGTARPAVGSEKNAAAVTTVVVESMAPAPLAFVPAGPAAQEIPAEQTAAQEKEKEKAIVAEKAAKEKADKEKANAAKTIVVTTKGSKTPIEITITEGDQVKTLSFEKSLTITKGKNGEVLILTPEGKEPIVLAGEPLRLEIKGGGLEIVKEGMPLEIGEGGVYKIVKEAGEEGKNVIYIGTAEPEILQNKIRLAEKVEAGEAAPEVIVKRIKEVRPGEKWVAVEPVKEGQAVTIVKEVEPEAGWKVEGPEKTIAFSTSTDKMMLERVQALQEQVQAIKAKKMDLSALEDSLKKLEAELKANADKLKELSYKFDKGRTEYVFTKRLSGEEAEARAFTLKMEKEKEAEAAEGKAGVWVYEKSKSDKTAKARVFIGSDDKNGGTINLIFTGQDGEAGKAAFERAVAKLKKELPEGYKIVEQEYEADNGAMTFKISTPEGKKMDETLVKKLVELVQSEIKKTS
jgi:beta-lactamase regulating signal transducer with metallopeptidase domain